MSIQNNTNGFANNSFNIRSSANAHINANYGSISGGEQLAQAGARAHEKDYGTKRDTADWADRNHGRDSVEISNGNPNTERGALDPVFEAVKNLSKQLAKSGKKSLESGKDTQNAARLRERLGV